MFDDTAARERLEALLVCEPSTADRAELDRIVSLCAGVKSMVAAVEVAVARRSRQLQTSPAGESAADVLAGGRQSRREARAAAERERACAAMPSFEEALSAGAVSAGHVDALARATRGLDDATTSAVSGFEDDLLASAASSTVEAFERELRDLTTMVAGSDDANERAARQRSNRRLSRWVDRQTGMWKLFAEIDPETGAKLWTAIDAHLGELKQRDGNAEIPLERLAVDALVELVTKPAGEGARRVPEVYVHIDWLTILSGLHGATLCELSNGIPLPVDTVRRMCCEATIVPILLGPDGTPVDAGREVRTANRKQRRLLRAMYRTCAHPHCDVPFDYCDIHHVIPWQQLGGTDLDNLLPLCGRHHHLVHEGGWQLTLTPERVITLTRPDGTVAHTGNTTNRHPTTMTVDAAAPAPVPTSGAPPRRRAA